MCVLFRRLTDDFAGGHHHRALAALPHVLLGVVVGQCPVVCQHEPSRLPACKSDNIKNRSRVSDGRPIELESFSAAASLAKVFVCRVFMHVLVWQRVSVNGFVGDRECVILCTVPVIGPFPQQALHPNCGGHYQCIVNFMLRAKSGVSTHSSPIFTNKTEFSALRKFGRQPFSQQAVAIDASAIR